jgi:hypothetical protein
MPDQDLKVQTSAVQNQRVASSATSQNESIIVDYQKY